MLNSILNFFQNYKEKYNTTQILPHIDGICYFVALRGDSLYFFDVLMTYRVDVCLNAGRMRTSRSGFQHLPYIQFTLNQEDWGAIAQDRLDRVDA